MPDFTPCISPHFCQLIQLVRAVDRDEDGNMSRIIIRSPLGAKDPNITVRDNKGKNLLPIV